jgi:hypothetical protein
MLRRTPTVALTGTAALVKRSGHKNICVSIHAKHGDHTGPGNDYNGRLSLSGVACD